MTQTTINRRRALAVVAAVPAAVALSVPALASAGEDAELRQLWAQYLLQLDAHNKARNALRDRRPPYDAEFDSLRDIYPRAFGELHDRLWTKHGLVPLAAAWNREGRKLRRIVRAIQEAKAESLFGVGVKLSVAEDPNAVDVVYLASAIDDARRAIAELIGVDFIAAAGSRMDDV